MPDAVRTTRLPLVVLCAFYFVLSAAFFTVNETSAEEPVSVPVLILGLVTIALYGGLAVVLLVRRDVDAAQARVFTLLAVLITATIALTTLKPGAAPPWLFGVLFVLTTLVYLVNPAVIIHMAALIPVPHRVLKRLRWFLPAHYAAFLVLALAVAFTALSLLKRSPEQAQAFRGVTSIINAAVMVYAGFTALVLLGRAARREPRSRARRQALMVFFGVLPWTAVQTARLVFLPFGLETRLAFDAVEMAAIFLVPVTMFIAIVGFRMFGLELLVRRGLIYGITLGLPFAVLAGLWLAAGVFASRALGFEAAPLTVGLVLLMAGLLLRPLVRRVTAWVDRMFFPEKIALRRLPRAVIGELATHTDLDKAAGRLVERLKRDLQVQNAALLTADEDRRFFRVRALASGDGPPSGAADVVLKAEDLARRPDLSQNRPASRLLSGGAAPGEWGAMLSLLGADTVIPVTLGGAPTALIVLGRPLAGGYFDRDDLEKLEVLAEQVAAVIEHARVQELARIDPLTSLPQRHVALDRLAEELERGRRSGRFPAAALADIDDFKRVNDRHGHLVGDRALRAVSDALRARARSTDLVARFGGEEMLIVLPESDAPAARAVCEAMRLAVREKIFAGDKGEPLSVTVSIGVAAAEPRDTVERLIARADEALYQAKRTGKDRVCISPAA